MFTELLKSYLEFGACPFMSLVPCRSYLELLGGVSRTTGILTLCILFIGEYVFDFAVVIFGVRLSCAYYVQVDADICALHAVFPAFGVAEVVIVRKETLITPTTTNR